MLELLGIIFLVITIPIRLPVLIGIFGSLLGLAGSLISFGVMLAFWLLFIAVIIYLVVT